MALALFDVARLDIGRETRIYLQQLLIRRAFSCFHFHFPFFIASILILAQLFRFFCPKIRELKTSPANGSFVPKKREELDMLST